MKPATFFSLIAAVFGLALLQMLGTMAAPWAALAAGGAVGILVFPLFRLFGIEMDRIWLPMVTATGASCLGTAAGALGIAQRLTWEPLAPFCALLLSGAILALQNRRSRLCQLCRRQLAGALAFQCPRCNLLVCERKCWQFDSCRCRLCAENAVSVFPQEPRWWDQQFGSRVSAGACQLCLAEPPADLRACGNCGRPQCRECWDYANGQCGHCGWVVSQLPPALERYMKREPAAVGAQPRPKPVS